MTKPKSSLLETLLRILFSGRERSKKIPRRERRKPDAESQKDKSKSRHEKKDAPKYPTSRKPVINTILSEAQNLLGTPYKYAGTTPQEGFDCSGLVYYVYRKAGHSLQRTSYLQATEGAGIEPNETSPGDLIFFAHSGERINHVGIVTSRPGEPLRMIHSSSSRGVIHTNVSGSEYWNTRLKGARRVV